MPVPEALIAPELHFSMVGMLNAYLNLDTERTSLGELPGRIPISKIYWYGETIAGYSGTELTYFVDVILTVDAKQTAALLKRYATE
jgi:hypothetical protein